MYAFTGIYIWPCCDIWSVPNLGQMRSVFWVLKEVDPVGLHRQSGIHSFSGKVGIVNKTPSNLKLHHITKNPS